MSLFTRGIRRLLDRRLGPASKVELIRIEQLRARIQSLPQLRIDPSMPATEQDWLASRIEIRKLLMEQDPRAFLRWQMIRYRMFVDCPDYVRDELAELKRDPEWMVRWKPAAREDKAGLPTRCRYALSSSGNLIHHLYSIWQFEQLSGRRIETEQSVLEFGGGYGSLCRAVHRLGFKGRYVIFDLPEFSALQSFYLQLLGLPVIGENDSLPVGGPNIHCINDPVQLTALLPGGTDLFVATWSISETSIPFRTRFLESLPPVRDTLIAYQENFQEVDNCKFFSSWSSNSRDAIWQDVAHACLPGNRFLVGCSKFDGNKRIAPPR